MTAWEIFNVHTAETVETFVGSYHECDDYVCDQWGGHYDFDVASEATNEVNVPRTTLLYSGS